MYRIIRVKSKKKAHRLFLKGKYLHMQGMTYLSSQLDARGYQDLGSPRLHSETLSPPPKNIYYMTGLFLSYITKIF